MAEKKTITYNELGAFLTKALNKAIIADEKEQKQKNNQKDTK